MDEVERLIQVFSALGAMASAAAKLDVLLDLERLRDRRVVFFLVRLLGDPSQPAEVRVHVLKRLRNGPLTADDRVTVAGALRQLLSSGSSLDLRLQAALALGEFTEIAAVLPALGALALEPHESIDLRYAAFTSLERAGPTTECVNLLYQLSSDDMLGCAVRSVLVRWRLE
jgi:HEAT repeat protein